MSASYQVAYAMETKMETKMETSLPESDVSSKHLWLERFDNILEVHVALSAKQVQDVPSISAPSLSPHRLSIVLEVDIDALEAIRPIGLKHRNCLVRVQLHVLDDSRQL